MTTKRVRRIKTDFNPEFPLTPPTPLEDQPPKAPAGHCPECGKPLGRRDEWFYSQDYRVSLHFDCLGAYAATHNEPEDDGDEYPDEDKD